MSCAAIDIMGMGPRQYPHGGGEEINEIEDVGPSRRTKIPWDKFKDPLYKSYVEEDKPLPVVMKIMKGLGLHATYQIGEKWKWKKYNQGAGKSTPPRTRKSRSHSNLGDAHEDVIVVASSDLDVPGRDIDALRILLFKLFTDRPLDEKCLGILRTGIARDVARCLRLCFHWCKEEIHVDDAKFPAPYGDGTDREPDVSEDNYGCDVRIFIYLLHRYIGSSAVAEHDSWETLAKQTVGFCPIKMLYTMSTLIVVVVGSALKRTQEANPFTPPPSLSNIFNDLFDVAKLGVSEMDRWDDEKLLTEFCDEFETILKDYAGYGEAISSAVRKYMMQNWPEADMHEELGFMSDEDPYSSMYDEIMFPVDDIMSVN